MAAEKKLLFNKPEFFVSEQFQLLTRRTNIMRRTAKEKFHIAELLVRDAKQTYLSIRRKNRFYTT